MTKEDADKLKWRIRGLMPVWNCYIRTEFSEPIIKDIFMIIDTLTGAKEDGCKGNQRKS